LKKGFTQTGPWSEAEVKTFLDDSRVPIRVASNSASGYPLLASLWFVPLEGSLWCATQQNAQIARQLASDPRCAFEVSVEAPPYLGVRGRATGIIHTNRGEEILRVLLLRYLGCFETPPGPLLLSKAQSEVAIEIRPETLVSWDYRQRMTAGAPAPPA